MKQGQGKVGQQTGNTLTRIGGAKEKVEVQESGVIGVGGADKQIHVRVNCSPIDTEHSSLFSYPSSESMHHSEARYLSKE